MKSEDRNRTVGMKRRRFLKTLGAGTAGLAASLAAGRAAGGSEDRPPNVLLIMADDVGREVLGCYGGQSYLTPNLDGLADGGIRFTHCHSNPVCSPSRVRIMTGRYQFRTTQKWGHIPPDEVTFGHVLQQAGYATAVAGKWQMCLLKDRPDHAEKMGFDESCIFGWHEGPRYQDPLLYINGERRRLEGQYGPDVYCDFLIDFMKRNRDRPFLAYYSMALCHAIADDFSPPPPPPRGERFRGYKSFRNMAHYMDRNVGYLIDALEKLGLRENTLVLFTGDNGTTRSVIADVRDGHYIHVPVISMQNGKAVRGGKGSLNERGTGVPLVANWPGTAPSGRVRDDLIDFSDFMPTLAEVAGADLPQDVAIDGRSFAPQLRGKEGRPRDWIYTQHGGRAWARTKRWKLYLDGRFYDMEKDVEEEHPIEPGRGSAAAEAARRKLRGVLRKLRGDAGA